MFVHIAAHPTYIAPRALATPPLLCCGVVAARAQVVVVWSWLGAWLLGLYGDARAAACHNPLTTQPPPYRKSPSFPAQYTYTCMNAMDVGSMMG